VLVFWVSVYGIRKGDWQTIRLIGPDGTVMAEDTSELPGPKILWRAWTGRKLKTEAWPPGVYRGEYRIVHRSDAGAEETMVDVSREIEVRAP
jgi:hypothetical protein